MISPQIVNLQICSLTANVQIFMISVGNTAKKPNLCQRVPPKKRFKTVSKVIFFKINFFSANMSEENIVFAVLRKFKSAKRKKESGSINRQIRKYKRSGSANCKYTNFHIGGRSANLTIISPQICGFEICGTFLRTAHLCTQTALFILFM